MDIKSLEEWLRQSRQAGLSDTQIHEQLKSTGWTDQQINELFSGDMFRQGQLEAVGATKKDDFDTMAGLTESQAGTGGSLPGLFTLMGQAWALFKSRIINFIVIGIITGIISGIFIVTFFMITGVGISAGLSGLSTVTNITNSGSSPLHAIGMWSIGFFGLGALIAVFSFVYAWVQTSLILAITDEGITIGGMLSKAFKLTIPYWWLTVLIGFLVTGASFVVFVPGIVFGLWFSFAVYILFTENIHGMQALLKSKEYVRGYWWAVFFRNLSFGLTITLPLIGLSFAASYLKIQTIFSFIQLIVGFFLTPFIMCFSYSIYKNLQAIKGIGISVPQKKAGIIITAILGLIIIPIIFFSTGGFALGGVKSKVADATRKSDISRIYTAAYIYYDENNSYPNSLQDLVPKYLNSLPTDPKNGDSYTYTLTSDRKNFSLCAQLNTTDTLTGSKEYCKTSQVTTSNNRNYSIHQ